MRSRSPSGLRRKVRVLLKSAALVPAAMLALALPGAGQRPTSRPPKHPSGSVQDPVTPTGNDVFMEALVDEKPVVLWAPRLVYPEVLRQALIEGRVMVRAILDTMGHAEANSLKILESPNPGFDESAKAWVRRALFRPARIHGRAVRVLIQVPIEFRLR